MPRLFRVASRNLTVIVIAGPRSVQLDRGRNTRMQLARCMHNVHTDARVKLTANRTCPTCADDVVRFAPYLRIPAARLFALDST